MNTRVAGIVVGTLLLGAAALSGAGASPAEPAPTSPAAGAAATPATIDRDLATTMRAWCSQAGTWRGTIDVTDPKGVTTKVVLVSRHRCTPDGLYHVVEEDALTPAAGERPARSDHSLKVTYADPALGGFHTAYFFHGHEAPYRFLFASVEFRDERHWKQSIVSPPDGGEKFDGRPAILRYTRELDGDRLTSRKDVKFLDVPDAEFVQRSVIVQERVPGP